MHVCKMFIVYYILYTNKCIRLIPHEIIPIELFDCSLQVLFQIIILPGLSYINKKMCLCSHICFRAIRVLTVKPKYLINNTRSRILVYSHTNTHHIIQTNNICTFAYI